MTAESLLQEAKLVADALGYSVFEDCLEGCGGGYCRTAGREWIVLDRNASGAEKLRQLLWAIQDDTRLPHRDVTGVLTAALAGETATRTAAA
jgi:hypothetical protein